MENIDLAIQLRNQSGFRTRIESGAPGAVGPQGPAGPVGPGNIDGGRPQSFYAGISSIDAGYYDETYGGIMYGITGGTP
jgi:hypothetical protein